MEANKALIAWYKENSRELPWRSTRDPYLVWLSEIILQQTRVAQGLPYYERFASAFPTVQDLASAPSDQVLRLWQGLGYYSRARNMHEAAKYISSSLGGRFPEEARELLKIKGIGEYTAAAIASIVFDKPEAVVDGNVVRVLSRYLSLSVPFDTAAGKKMFRAAALEFLDRDDPASHNQAVMELGALVCTPQNPDCPNCPLSETCLAFAENRMADFPVKTKKPARRERFFHYYLMSDGNSTLIRKRGPGDIWEGLYEFPLSESAEHPSFIPRNGRIRKSKGTKHILTHQVIHGSFYEVMVPSLPDIPGYIEVPEARLGEYPFPRLITRFLESDSFRSGR